MPVKKRKVKPTKQASLSSEFYSDMEAPDMLFSAIVRSNNQIGKFSALNYENLPEAYTLFTFDDIPGEKEIKTLGMSFPIFANKEITYLGEAVALLVGPEENKVLKLASEVEIVFDTDKKNSDEKIETKKLIYERTIKTGLAKSKSAEFDSLFSKTDFDIQETWSSMLSSPFSSEPNGVFCIPSKQGVKIFTPTQWPSHLQKNLSSVLNISEENIFIDKTVSSSPHTNSLWMNTVLAAQASLAVLKTGKPVKLILSRQEHIDFLDSKGNVSITHRTAVSKDGRIRAMKINILFEAGYKNPFAKEILDRLVIASSGIYNPQSICVTASAYETVKPASSINLESIDSQAFFAIENQIQKICDLTGFSPIEFRLKNIRLSTTKKNYMPFNFNLKKIEDALKAISSFSDFERRFVSYRQESHYYKTLPHSYEPYNMPLRGIGISCAMDGSGYFGTSIIGCEQKMEATFNKDGTLSLHALPPSDSIFEIWKNTAAEILEIEPKMVKLNSEFDLKDESLIPENMYSNLSIMTQLLKKCCTAIQNKRFRNPLPISVSKKITPLQLKQWNKENFSGVPFHSTSFASAVIDLEVDACTFKIDIRSIWIIINAGKIVISKAAEQTVRLAVNHILTELITDEYIDSKKVKISFIQSEAEPCQLGGLITKVIPAAFSSAISQATARMVTHLPIKSNSLYVKEILDENIINPE